MSTVITDTEAKMNLSVNLRRLLKREKLTSYRLAKDIDEPLNTIYRIVRGENVPNAVLLARIAERLNVPIDYLLSFPKKRRR